MDKKSEVFENDILVYFKVMLRIYEETRESMCGDVKMMEI
jgi:hypothetical protein